MPQVPRIRAPGIPRTLNPLASLIRSLQLQRLRHDRHIRNARLLHRVHHAGEGPKRHSLIAAQINRLVSLLERGAGEMHGAAGFRVEARGLTVRSETGRGAARIRLTGATRVQVAAIEGGLRVLNPRGVLVAELDAGSALEFEPQLPGGPAGEQEKLTGCLRSSSGHYLLTDEVTNVTVEVAGSGLDKEHGNRVQVTGLMDPAGTPVSGATQYVRVSSIKRIGRGCPANRPAAAGAGGTASSKSPGGAVPNNGAGGAVPGNGAGGAAPNKGGGNPSAGGAGGAGAGAGGASAGGIAATTLAIIGGVAAAVVVGGLAATGTFSSASSQESR